MHERADLSIALRLSGRIVPPLPDQSLQLPNFNRRTDFLHQVFHKMQVVPYGEVNPQRLPGHKKMPKVGPGISPAGGTGAVCLNRTLILPKYFVADPEAEAFARLASSVPVRARRVGAAQSSRSIPCSTASRTSSTQPMPRRCRGLLFRQMGDGPPQNLRHPGPGLAQVAADSQPVKVLTCNKPGAFPP